MSGRKQTAGFAGHIVVVDDEEEFRRLIVDYLSQEGFRVSSAAGGAEMWRVLERDPADLVILDLKMPGEDGHSLARRLRAGSEVGIIMLTGKGEQVDTIVGLELGADDYLRKPCDLRELLARVRAVMRRSRAEGGTGREELEPVFTFGGWSLNTARRELTAADGKAVPLTAAEYTLLTLFAERPGRVLSRDHLLEMTQGRAWSPYDRSLDNLVSRLRRKIEENPNNPAIIKTVRGVGYVFAETVRRADSARR